MKKLDVIYISLMFFVLGVAVTMGAMVVPVIFNTDKYLSDVMLLTFQQGTLMTVIFGKLATTLKFLIVAIILYELYNFKKFFKDKIATILTLVIIFSSFMFSFYYYPKMLDSIKKGEEYTQTEAFNTMHTNSELSVKILSFSMLVLTVRKISKKEA